MGKIQEIRALGNTVVAYAKTIPPKNFYKKFEYSYDTTRDTSNDVFPTKNSAHNKNETKYGRTLAAKARYEENNKNVSTVGFPKRYVSSGYLTSKVSDDIKKILENPTTPVIMKSEGAIKDDIRDFPQDFIDKDTTKLVEQAPFHYQVVVPENVFLSLTSSMPSIGQQLNERMVILDACRLVDADGRLQIVVARYHYPDDPEIFYNCKDKRFGAVDIEKTLRFFFSGNTERDEHNRQMLQNLITGYMHYHDSVILSQMLLKYTVPDNIPGKTQKQKNDWFIDSLGLAEKIKEKIQSLQIEYAPSSPSTALVVIEENPKKDTIESQKPKSKKNAPQKPPGKQESKIETSPLDDNF
jgi:hypothetical protein